MKLFPILQPLTEFWLLRSSIVKAFYFLEGSLEVAYVLSRVDVLAKSTDSPPPIFLSDNNYAAPPSVAQSSSFQEEQGLGSFYPKVRQEISNNLDCCFASHFPRVQRLTVFRRGFLEAPIPTESTHKEVWHVWSYLFKAYAFLKTRISAVTAHAKPIRVPFYGEVAVRI